MGTKKRKSNIPEGESKAEAFVRLGTQRVRKALKAIRAIGNLSVRPHGAGQSAAIVGALKTAVEDVEFKLGGAEEAASAEFSLGDEPEEE
jgi:hypothetical protein